MRIRTIKPSYFMNEELAELSPLTRLLFIGLWCLADCEGRLEDRPKRIRAEVMPYDDGDVDAMLTALEGAGFLHRYAANGQRFIEVVGFRKHQRINGKEAENPSQIPGRFGVMPETLGGSSGEALGKQSGSDGAGAVAQEGKGREGNRKGREGNGDPHPPTLDDAASPRLDAAAIMADPANRWRYERQTTWARALSPVLGSKLGDKLGPRLWEQYKRLHDVYGLNLVASVAGDLAPDDRWPEKLETALIKARADLARHDAIAPDADPLVAKCQGIIAEHGWELCLGVVKIGNVPDESTLLEALTGNRALARKLVAHFDPDADRAQQGAA